MLDNLKIIHERDAHDALGAAERFWHGGNPEHIVDTSDWIAIVPTARNSAKQLALDIIGKTPIMYSGPLMSPVAAHWKFTFNQHAKHLAWTSEYPDHLEAELTGWTKQPVYKPYVIIDLRSSFEAEEVQRAFELAGRLLSGRRPAPYTVQAQGDSLEAHTAWAKAFGDFVAIYVALLCNVSPSSRPFSNKLEEKI